MSGLHTWTGLLLGWLLYAIFLTGAVSYFREEITRWAQPLLPPASIPAPDQAQQTRPDAVQAQQAAQGQAPAIGGGAAAAHAGGSAEFVESAGSERSAAPARPGAIDAASLSRAELTQRTVEAMQHHAPGAERWRINLPSARSSDVTVQWNQPRPPKANPRTRQRPEEARFDPGTGTLLPVARSRGGDFFYHFHYNLHYMPPIWGRWIVSLCAMFMLVAIISGIITHKKIFADFFTFRGGKGQRSWLDAHNGLSVLGLPFHLMITYSGLVTLMLMLMPWGADLALRTPAQEAALRAQISQFRPPEAAAAARAPLARVDRLVEQAAERWGADGVDRITITHPGHGNARISISRADRGRVSDSPQYLLFDGVSGELLEVHDQVKPTAETRGVLVALHTGRFADLWIRWIYLLLGLAGTAMIGSGLVLWTVKRRARLPDPERPYFGFRLVEKLNIATIAGLPVAMSAFLGGSRLLPPQLPARTDWEAHLFFIAWGLMALHALLRPPRQAWIEQFVLAALLLTGLALLDAFGSGPRLFESLGRGDWGFAGFDLSLLALAALMAAMAWRTAHHPGPKKAAKARPRPAAAQAARDSLSPALAADGSVPEQRAARAAPPALRPAKAVDPTPSINPHPNTAP